MHENSKRDSKQLSLEITDTLNLKHGIGFPNQKLTQKFAVDELKSDFHLSKKFFTICINDSPSQMMKNAFYFILKALFLFKIFIFLSWLFGHVEKTTWLER